MTFGAWTAAVRILMEKVLFGGKIREDQKIRENIRKIQFSEDEGSEKEEWRWATGGPHHPLARAALGHTSRWCGCPGPPLALSSGVYHPPETLRLRERPQKDSAASARQKTPREKDLSGRQISAEGIPSRRGEIVAINTTIKLDFIGIIIIITTITITISTLLTISILL